MHDKSNRVTRWSVPVTPPPAAALADTLGRRRDRSDQSHDSPLLDPELLRRVGQRWSSPLVVPSDQLSLLEHWPSPPPPEQKLWSLRLRVRFERLSVDDDDDGRWYRAIFSNTFWAARILSKFKSPPVPWNAKN